MTNSVEATLIAIMQNIRAAYSDNPYYGPNASALALVESVQSDKELNQKDINELVLNTALDQGISNNPEQAFQKIAYLLQDSPETAEEILKFSEQNQIDIDSVFSPEALPEFGKIIEAMISTIKMYGQGGQFDKLETTKTVTIKDKEYSLLVFTSDEEKELGLSNVETMDDNEGGLFVYKSDPQSELSFWMQDTTIPLDIIFVGSDANVVDVKQGSPLSEELLTCVSEENPIAWVIELNRDSGVSVGDHVSGLKIEPGELDTSKLYVLNEDGSIQAEIDAESRIFSRKSTAVIIKKAKKAFESKSDVDYKDLGRYVFGELDRQDGRDPEYVESPNKSDETKMPE